MKIGKHLLALIGINIAGLTLTDRQQIEEVGFTRWLNGVSLAPPTRS